MKIYLIGMPGSGKTTLGKQLASKLALSFVDLDHEIERHENKSIPEIFDLQGEDYFRQIESELLKQWASSSKSFVMSTGGGTPCFHGGMEVINQSGISIFLDAPVTQLVKRVEKETKRPLLQTSDQKELTDKLENLRASRLTFYRQAKITVENPSLDTVLEKIKK
jgi:shikimate kinase